MKKIMFSDTYQLTQAVLDGRKTADKEVNNLPQDIQRRGRCRISRLSQNVG